MDHLSKQQIVLLAILISFVTSLATGIVTVSLMDQAPSGVTRTVTQVIRETVASAVPASGATSTAAVSIAVNDQVANAVSTVVPSIVRLRDGDTGPVTGIGLFVSSQGLIMTDKSIMDKLNNPEAVFADGTAMPVSVVRFQIAGDIAFLAPARTFSKTVKPITFADPAQLGSTVWTLTGTSTLTLSQGIVNELAPAANTPSNWPIMKTSMAGQMVLPGAPLFNAVGQVVGMETSTLSGGSNAAYYPVAAAQAGVPQN